MKSASDLCNLSDFPWCRVRHPRLVGFGQPCRLTVHVINQRNHVIFFVFYNLRCCRESIQSIHTPYHSHTQTHTHAYVNTHTRTHTHSHAHAHTHVLTHALSSSSERKSRTSLETNAVQLKNYRSWNLKLKAWNRSADATT